MGLAFGHSGRPVHFGWREKKQAAGGELAMRGIEPSSPQGNAVAGAAAATRSKYRYDCSLDWVRGA